MGISLEALYPAEQRGEQTDEKKKIKKYSLNKIISIDESSISQSL